MRILLAAAALAAVPALAATEAAMAQPHSDRQLAPGEVLLEIEARGTSVDPARHARLMAVLTGTGVTPAEARSALEAEVARAVAAARAAGVAADDVRPTTGLTRFGFIGNEVASALAGMDPNLESESQPRQRRSTAGLDILVRDPAAADRVAAALEGRSAARVSSPLFEVADEDSARRAARADAFRRARADAEALAAASNMRVARVLRISERRGTEAAGLEMMQAMRGERRPPRPAEVETIVTLSADFALVPR